MVINLKGCTEIVDCEHITITSIFLTFRAKCTLEGNYRPSLNYQSYVYFKLSLNKFLSDILEGTKLGKIFVS